MLLEVAGHMAQLCGAADVAESGNHGINQSVARTRMYRGWPDHLAVTLSVGSRYR
jgi:hypothetical protein